MIMFLLSAVGLIIIVLALKQGKKDGYPYLGEADFNKDEDND